VTPPNSGLVAVAWVRGITAASGFDPARVAASLPTGDTGDALLRLGWVQVAVVGGSPNIDVPVRRPVVQIDAWVMTQPGGKPPWGQAWALAEVVRLATEGVHQWRRAVTMPAGYDPAHVLTAMAVSEPREIRSDPGLYARVSFDVEIHWRPGA